MPVQGKDEDFMTVGKLKAIIADLPDDMVVIVLGEGMYCPMQAKVRPREGFEDGLPPSSDQLLELWS